MSNWTLDRTFRAMPETGIPANRAVVFGGEPGFCDLPAGANAAGVIGVATHTQPRAGRAVAVRIVGVGRCEAASAIDAGDAVCVADSTGRIRTAPRPVSQVAGSTGAGNAVAFEWRGPAGAHAGASVVVAASNADQPLSASVDGSAITIELATDAMGDAETTASELVEFVNAHPAASALVRASGLPGSTGYTAAAAATLSFGDNLASANPIGVAIGSATAAGDLVDVLMTPRA